MSDTFNARFAPASTPPDIVAFMARESRAAMQRPEVRDAARKADYEIVAGTPEQLSARRQRDRRGEGSGDGNRYQAGIGLT